MKSNQSTSIKSHPATASHLKLVAKISLIVSFTTSLLLVLIIVLLTGGKPHTDYVVVIQSLSSAQKLLGPAMLVSGLLIVTIIGFLTWGISVYSSARITGALYRFSRNLEQKIDHRLSPLLNIRKTDHLHPEASRLEQTINTLNAHYDSLVEAIEAIELALSETHPDQLTDRNGQVYALVGELKALEAKVSLSDG